jgi:DNA-directed RNA polymerase subunit K
MSRPTPGEVVRLAESERLRYTRFERARIIGARALQISMGAPLLVDVPVGMVDPIDIADLEFGKRVIPITVKR